jgi:hypothetical protein
MRTIIAFPSSHAAMEAELLAEDAGYACRLIPLPPAIHAGCGIVLLCEHSVILQVADLLAAKRVPTDGVYDKNGDTWHRRLDS